jgi:hypothetical protein
MNMMMMMMGIEIYIYMHIFEFFTKYKFVLCNGEYVSECIPDGASHK